VNFAVGIFDLFTYTIPGALALALMGYVAVRLDWVDPTVVADAPSLLVAVVVVLAAYLLGYLVYPLGAPAEKVVPRRRRHNPRDEFVGRVPAAGERPYVQEDRHLLLSAVQLHDREVALEVTRLRAASLMLRNAAPLLGLGAVVGAVEVFTSGRPAFASVAAVLLAAGYVAVIVQARRMRHWAGLKTLELCFWLPDVDEKFAAD